MKTKDEIRELLATLPSKTLAHTDERPDGTAQVYSPSRGPMRVIVPVAETVHEYAPALASMPTIAQELIEVKELLAELHAEVDEWDVQTEFYTGCSTCRQEFPNHAEDCEKSKLLRAVLEASE